MRHQQHREASVKPLQFLFIFLLGLLIPHAGYTSDSADTQSDRHNSDRVSIPNNFDSIGPTMRTLKLRSGRTIAYIDEGRQSGMPVLFVGGAGTSGRVFALLEFVRTLRENLNIRIISVERNGFGQTAFDPTLSYADYSAEVEELLEHLGVNRFVAFAISGGGPYITEIASRNADRLISVHLASALSSLDPASSSLCSMDQATIRARFSTRPMIWFAFPPDSPVHTIPGFQDAAFDDAARTFDMGGQTGDPAPLHHELQLYCNEPLAKVSAVDAPVFIYHGEADTVVPPKPHVENWQNLYSRATITLRLYPNEGHDVQYRHWDQILVDISGRSDKTVICSNGKSQLMPERQAQHLLETSAATLGICAWQQ